MNIFFHGSLSKNIGQYFFHDDDKCYDQKRAYLDIDSENLKEIELISKNLCQFISKNENNSTYHVDEYQTSNIS